jgi:hypothetical protein
MEWDEQEQDQRKGVDWAEEDEIEGYRGMPTPLTHLEPEGEVYKGYGMADEPPDAATSLEHGTWPNTNAVPLEYKHQLWEHAMASPSWEHTGQPKVQQGGQCTRTRARRVPHC